MKRLKYLLWSIAGILFFVVNILRESSIREDREDLRRITDDRNKLIEINRVWARMINAKQSGYSVSEFFKDNGYSSVAIYGMKELGEALLHELRANGIDVKYGIDKNRSIIVPGLEIFSLEDELEDVDVIVVTAIHYFEDVGEQISRVLDCPVVSIEDLFLY